MLEWSYFPKTDPLPDFLKESVDVFEKKFHLIDSFNDKEEKYVQNSDTVLQILSKEFQNLDYLVETGKKKNQKIRVPVLFGHKGTVSQAFEVDGWHKKNKIVLEIEAGRALANHQFLKDIFEASVMVDIDYLILAVRQIYKKNQDYKKITEWLDTLFITNRIKLSLKGILLIGY
tara:strand:+ start:121 stop:642 length:522 start_codon:yes stop_codon:yes gene_type:complete